MVVLALNNDFRSSASCCISDINERDSATFLKEALNINQAIEFVVNYPLQVVSSSTVNIIDDELYSSAKIESNDLLSNLFSRLFTERSIPENVLFESEKIQPIYIKKRQTKGKIINRIRK